MTFSHQATPRSTPEPSGALRVPQRTYAIVKTDGNVEALITRRIWSCTGYVGVNPKTGVAFCAHFDSPFAVLGLKRMLKDVKAANGGNLEGFTIYDVAGLPPWFPAACSMMALVFWFQGWNVLITWILLLIGMLFLATRFMLSLTLIMTSGHNFKSLKYRRLGVMNSYMTASVRIDTAGRLLVDTGPVPDDQFFHPPKRHGSVVSRYLFYFALQKAQGSR